MRQEYSPSLVAAEDCCRFARSDSRNDTPIYSTVLVYTVDIALQKLLAARG